MTSRSRLALAAGSYLDCAAALTASFYEVSTAAGNAVELLVATGFAGAQGDTADELRLAVARQQHLLSEFSVKVRTEAETTRYTAQAISSYDAYERLMMKHGYNADQLANKLDKSRSYIYGRLKLCALNLDVREQFLDNEEQLPASTALLIARIPVTSLQTKALTEILRPNGLPTDEPMSYRRAKQWIQDKYMLDLRKAIFMTDDAKLVKAAGNCNKCPKRAGNQPVVFEGVDANICTDPECFQEKTAAHYAQVVMAAKKNGIPVYEGDDAREVWSTIYRRNSKYVLLLTA